MDKFIKQSHQHVKSDIITDLPGAFRSLQPSTAEKSSPSSSSEKRKKLNKGSCKKQHMFIKDKAETFFGNKSINNL